MMMRVGCGLGWVCGRVLGVCILVIEDEFKMMVLLVWVLIEEGYMVDIVVDGCYVVVVVDGGDYDVVVLDVMLFGIDGFEVCVWL